MTTGVSPRHQNLVRPADFKLPFSSTLAFAMPKLWVTCSNSLPSHLTKDTVSRVELEGRVEHVDKPTRK